MELGSDSVLHTLHFSATLGTCLTGPDTFLHPVKLLTIVRARLANLSAQAAKTMLKGRATKLEISRGLANLRTTDHQTKVIRCNVLSAGLEAVVHGGLQADLMAMAARLDTGLHGLFSVG